MGIARGAENLRFIDTLRGDRVSWLHTKGTTSRDIDFGVTGITVIIFSTRVRESVYRKDVPSRIGVLRVSEIM